MYGQVFIDGWSLLTGAQVHCIINSVVFVHRYTANDPCHSRCQFLYKDHYHCNSPNCGMLYKSKDGVREHAK